MISSRLLTGLVSVLVVACSPQAAVTVDSLDVVQVGKNVYAFPADFLGWAHVAKVEEIVPLHVHYPDLAPVGDTSGRCVHKVVLTDLACPYFSIFLVPSGDKKFGGEVPDGATFVREEGAYKLFDWAGSDYYQWHDAYGKHSGYCLRPSMPRLEEPFGHTTCDVSGVTPSGGAYRIVFAYEWRAQIVDIDRQASTLVDSFIKQARRFSEKNDSQNAPH